MKFPDSADRDSGRRMIGVRSPALPPEPAQEGGKPAVMHPDDDAPVLPGTVFSRPAARRGISLVLVDIVHAAAAPERLAEHKDRTAGPQQGLEVREGLDAGPVFPWNRRLQFRAPEIVEGPGSFTGTDPVPAWPEPLKTGCQRTVQPDDAPFYPFGIMFAVKVDGAEVTAAPGVDPERAMVITPSAPPCIAGRGGKGAGEDAVSIQKGHEATVDDQ